MMNGRAIIGGGEISREGDYTVHTFKGSGTYLVTLDRVTVEVTGAGAGRGAGSSPGFNNINSGQGELNAS